MTQQIVRQGLRYRDTRSSPEVSLFWIQTRTIECNYCMGHCEMLLEVAGLDKKAVAARTSQLASGDWSAFPAEEQRAYAYARKLSKAPWTLTAEDYRTLEQDLGPAKAMSTFWWLCRGLYMTRIVDSTHTISPRLALQVKLLGFPPTALRNS